MKYLLTIAYDGRRYCGYQVQKNGVSIQEKLGEAAAQIFRVPCAVTGCSRTDSGVHARDFKATLMPASGGATIPADRVAVAINTALPEDIAVLRAEAVSEDFHPRYDVVRKEYVYMIHNARVRDPFLIGRAWHYPQQLNEVRMREAASYFVGTHDFASFMASGSDVTDTVRTVDRCEILRQGDVVTVTVSGNGFLYHMVRIMVGTLVAVSEGKLNPSAVIDILAARDRARAGMTAPACGLYLNRVDYPSDRKEDPT